MNYRNRYIWPLLAVLALTVSACAANTKESIPTEAQVTIAAKLPTDPVQQTTTPPESDIMEEALPCELPYVLSDETLKLDSQEYIIKVVQTAYKEIPGPEEDDYRMYISYIGMFDVVVQDAFGKEVSRLTSRDIFHHSIISLPTPPPIIFHDYNGDGNMDFVISDYSGYGPVTCAILSVAESGQISQLYCEGFLTSLYAYTSDESFNGEFPLLEGNEPGFKTWIYWDIHGKYVWDGDLFRFSLL